MVIDMHDRFGPDNEWVVHMVKMNPLNVMEHFAIEIDKIINNLQHNEKKKDIRKRFPKFCMCRMFNILEYILLISIFKLVKQA